MTKEYPEEFRAKIGDGKYTVIRYGKGGGIKFLRHGEEWPAADEWRWAGAIVSLVEALQDATESQSKAPGPTTEPEIQGEDGTVRKAHYGSGRQPWDDMIVLGWGPHFAAGSALKYIRRYKNKNGEDDLAKGRWYYGELLKRSADEINGGWTVAFSELEELLTIEERRILRAPATEKCYCDASCGESRSHVKGEPGCKFYEPSEIEIDAKARLMFASAAAATLGYRVDWNFISDGKQKDWYLAASQALKEGK